MNVKSWFVALVIGTLAVGCDDKKPDAPKPPETKPATSASAATAAVGSGASSVASAKESPPPAGATRFAVAMGKGTFLIDAPLEKIKGMSDEVHGEIDVVAKELAKSRGEVKVRVSTLKTSTFGDMDKDAAQTEHARNWMEVGPDATPESRMKHEWAVLTITSVEAMPASPADAKEENGARVVKAKVTGDFKLHGVTSKKTVPVTLTFKGPADSPTDMVVKTDEPMPVSLKEHDIKPRDKVGSFLNGALDRIGKKIDDKVQVSIEATSKATMPAHP